MFGSKYRPLTFEGVYGLSTIKEILQKALKTKVYDPAYLFIGPWSSGKTTIARIFARSILCPNQAPDMSPCNACSSCRSFLNKSNPGYLEVDAANNSTKDRIQEIKETFKYGNISGYEIVLFDEAHSISKDGKDALLDQLEQINNRIIIIFCTTEADKMPHTLSSRCLQFHLPEPAEGLIIEKLKKICEIQKIEYQPGALSLIVRATGRHYRDAENYLRQISLLGSVSEENAKRVVALYDEEIVKMLLSIPKDLSTAISTADNLVTIMDVRGIYHSILRILNDSIKYMNGVANADGAYVDLLKKMKVQYGGLLFEMLDYILAKTRLTDITFFQSDVLIMHHKFVKGGLNFKSFPAPSEEEQGIVRKEKVDSREVVDTKNLPPWQQGDLVRKFKMEKIKEKVEPKVPERVSDKWGPEVSGKVPAQLHKKKLTPSEFQRIVGGGTDGEKM